MNSVAHKSPLVEAIILTVIKRLEPKEPVSRPKYTLNTDLIPKVHESIVGGKTDFQESVLQPHHLEKLNSAPAQQAQHADIRKPLQIANHQVYNQIPTQKIIQTPGVNPAINRANPPISQRIQLPPHSFQKGYGKIQNLILDQGVSHIECQGANIPLSVVKFNQNQKTNITLTTQEIKELFEYVAEQAKIPSVEGVFKIVLGNMLFNGIISDSIGSKFMIKKNFQVEDLSK